MSIEQTFPTPKTNAKKNETLKNKVYIFTIESRLIQKALYHPPQEEVHT